MKKHQLVQDLVDYKLDILCLQESKIQDGCDVNILGHRVLLFESDCRYYGNGFVIHKSVIPSIQKAWKVNDRVCAIQLSLDSQDQFKKGRIRSITLFNIYGPTSALTRNNPDEIDNLYNSLQTVYDSLTNDTLILLAGDFNSKVGKKKEGETNLGSFSKGTRNDNGGSLVQFCEKKTNCF